MFASEALVQMTILFLCRPVSARLSLPACLCPPVLIEPLESQRFHLFKQSTVPGDSTADFPLTSLKRFRKIAPEPEASLSCKNSQTFSSFPTHFTCRYPNSATGLSVLLLAHVSIPSCQSQTRTQSINSYWIPHLVHTMDGLHQTEFGSQNTIH
jgi:hypothetical protein